MQPSILKSSYSDMNELLKDFCSKNHVQWYTDILIKYANKVQIKDVTELGIYQGISTSAFLTTNISSLKSYDITLSKMPIPLFKKLNKDIMWTVDIKNSVIDIINPTDLLFIDTVHTYEHLQKELTLHHKNVSNYIIIHDTNYPVKKSKKKVYNAVLEFVEAAPGWKVDLQITEHTGLMVLKYEK